jgi:hypothetical protein
MALDCSVALGFTRPHDRTGMANTGDDWDQTEVEIVVADYLGMLREELAGRSYNKAERNRALQQLLPGRSRGSIEFKHQNVSAVLIEMNAPYITGYKPRANFQALLRDVVENQLALVPNLALLAREFVEQPAAPPEAPGDLLAIEVPPPIREKRVAMVRQPIPASRRSIFPDYVAIEARNTSLGRAGEELVLEFEAQRLWRAGLKEYADKIVHVSAKEGDGAGFDILSFDKRGEDRLIEVKTTRMGADSRFFASKKEVEVSDLRSNEYHVYRVFQFGAAPKLFVLPGSLNQTCELEPRVYEARPGRTTRFSA